jgi:ligand-binding SRPBCC domain-containing protein
VKNALNPPNEVERSRVERDKGTISRLYTLTVKTNIAASASRSFDHARSVDAHVLSAGNSGERVVGGRTSGLLELGEEVTWEAWHLGIRQRLTSRITVFQPPDFFQDRMIKGVFKSFEHDHRFEADKAGGTVMVDVVRFEAPLGPLGWAARRLILARHLRRFLRKRELALKAMAESGKYL